MATTKTQVANGALDHVGEPPIADLDLDDSTRARACRRNFDQARDEVLRERDWNFATGWDQPAAGGSSLGPLKTRFPLPGDCLKVRFVDQLDDNGDIIPGGPIDIDAWAVESGDAAAQTMTLVTNATAPLVCYTKRLANPVLWDALFTAAMELKLAAKIATPLGKELDAAPVLDGRASLAVDLAGDVDADEKAKSEITRTTSWITARG